MKKNILNKLVVGCTALLAFSACSDAFLEDKKNYDNVTPDIYNYEEGVTARVADVYGWTLPVSNSDANWKYNSTGWADAQAKSTEEYAGFSVFVDPQNTLTADASGTEVPDYFMGDPTNIQNSVYGRIRNINDVIAGLQASSLSEEFINQNLGQVYFLRAWCYYQLVKWYGGVPIVKEMQDPVETAYTPRSSAKECIEFILEDLDKAAELLKPATGNGGWANSSDYGRITTGTALAVKGRVLLLWASPLFNRANDESRWSNAYNTMKADLSTIQGCGYGLFNQGNNVNASVFADMFRQVQSPENVFVTIRSSKDPDENGYYNGWEERIRPKNTGGVGSLTPSAMMIDLFPMADGKRPATLDSYTKLETSDEAYDSKYPFMGRDPRFYRTFVFPGFRWTYQGNATVRDANNPSSKGTDYNLWSYVWYTNMSDAGSVDKSDGYAADNLLANNRSVYLRKRSDDRDLGSPLYVYNETHKTSSFRFSGAPYIELRYAEVLLNLAEAACMAGQMGEAVELLKQIRQRAGYTGDCGLQANLASDQAACMSAILYERQIELAYEGKRFDDMRRWMLFDGGANMSGVQGAPATWTLSGWGGNTCTWLGVKPMNGQRRENIEYRTADKFGVGGKTFDSDPILAAGVARCAAVDLKKDLAPQLEVLQAWYQDNLVYKVRKGDGRTYEAGSNVDLYMKYQPKYYFLGLTQGAMSKNAQIEQTIGWEDTNKGGSNGTFDPLAVAAE